MFLLSCSTQIHCDISNEYKQGLLLIKVKNHTAHRFTNPYVQEVNIACLEPYSETRYFKVYLKMTSAPIMSGNKVDTWYNNWFDCISGELIAKSSKFIYTITGVCEKNQIILVEQKEL